MDLTSVVILGTLGMLLLAASIVAFVFVYQKKLIQRDLKIQKMQAEYQKDLLRATIQVQEKERKRIAQDLHDDIGAMLSTIRLGVAGMLRAKVLDERQSINLQNTRGLIDETIGNVRRLSRDLLPATLEEFGLVYALQELFSTIERNSSLDLVLHPSKHTSRMDQIVELALYRVVQELCNNIIKHANATKIEIWINQTSTELELILIDNGEGFVMGKPGTGQVNSHGLGLKNIESRLNMINATINYALAPIKGTKASIKMGYVFNKTD